MTIKRVSEARGHVCNIVPGVCANVEKNLYEVSDDHKLVASAFDQRRVLKTLGLDKHGDIVGVGVIYLATKDTAIQGIVAPVGDGRGMFFHVPEMHVEENLNFEKMHESLFGR